jgi:uncharacterized protein (TIGR02217 family)
VIGIGDGANQSFQLIKTYEGDGPNPYIRRITRPILDTVVFKVDGVVRAATHSALGLYTLSGLAPVDGAVVTATCEFDIPVRFDTDKFNLKLDQPDAGAIGSLPVVEVRE